MEFYKQENILKKKILPIFQYEHLHRCPGQLQVLLLQHHWPTLQEEVK
jgi:hypothetical protein